MKTVSRRELLRYVGLGGAAAVVAACQPKVVEVEKVVTQVVKETVVVTEEKVVKEAVEVEKEVTRVVEKQVEVEKAAGPEVKITHWNGFTGYDRPCLENLFNLFNSFREDIEMDYTVRPWDGIQETLAPAWAAGEGPDFVLVPSVWIPAYADAGLMLPLDDYIAGPNGMDADANVPMGYAWA
jgi:maltose-binding protein MalE